MRKATFIATALGSAVGFAMIPSASAATKVADATIVERDVSALDGSIIRKVGPGDGLNAQETVRTAAASAAKLRFVDETDIAIGPHASVTLDRFVFNPDQTAKAVTVSIGKGALRWVSGVSRSEAYEIRTPNAVLGVRGTIFDVAVAGSRTTVLLREGIVDVCNRSRSTCRTLSQPGDKITVTDNEVTGPVPDLADPNDFADRCLSARGTGCAVLAAIDTQPQPRTRVAPVREKRAEPAAKPKEQREPKSKASAPPARRVATAAPPPTRTASRPRRPSQPVEHEMEAEEAVARPVYGGPVYRPYPYRPRPVVTGPYGRPPFGGRPAPDGYRPSGGFGRGPVVGGVGLGIGIGFGAGFGVR